MLEAAVTQKAIRQEDPTERCPPPPPPAILALVGPSSRPEVLARAARVLRKGPSSPDRSRSVSVLGRTLVDGLRRRAPAEWWALGECAETLGVLGSDDEGAARCLHEALEIALGARANAEDAAEQLAGAVLRALAMLGSRAARCVPTISTMLEDVVLGPAAATALAAIDPSHESSPATQALTDRGCHVRALLPEDRVDLDAARRRARARTGLPAGAPPVEVVAAVAAEIRRIDPRAGEDARVDLAFELGVLWGDQIVRTARWEWVELSWDAGSAPAIVSPDRAHACFPTRLVADAIEASRGTLPAHAFRRIQTHALPTAAPGELAVIG